VALLSLDRVSACTVPGLVALVELCFVQYDQVFAMPETFTHEEYRHALCKWFLEWKL